MLLPGVEIVHNERQVATAMMGMDGELTVADQMQFLVGPEPKPSAGKVERGPIQGWEGQHITVERDALRDVADMQGDVIELPDFH